MLATAQESNVLGLERKNSHFSRQLVVRSEQLLNLPGQSFSIRAFTVPKDEKLLNPNTIQDRSRIIEPGILVSDRWITPCGTFDPSLGDQSVEILGNVNDLKESFPKGIDNPSGLWPNFVAKRLGVSLNKEGDAKLSVDKAKPFKNAVIVRIHGVADGAQINGKSLPNPKNNYLVTPNVFVVKEQLGAGYLGNRYFDITWMDIVAIMAISSEIAYFSLDGIALINSEVDHRGHVDTSVICPTVLRFNSRGKLELIKGPCGNDATFRNPKRRLQYLRNQLSNNTDLTIT